MNNKPDNSQISQRRRLLKGALAASSVATLSYGGAAAAASLGCIEKIATNGGGYPGAAYQFVEGDAPPAAVSGQGWAWEEVMVHEFQREASSAPTPSAVTPSSSKGRDRDRGNRGGGSKNNLPAEPSNSSTETVRAFRTRDGVYHLTTDHSVFDPTGWTQTADFEGKGWVLAYFNLDGSYAGSYPEHQYSTEDVTPASGSCLNSITPGGGSGFTFGG